MLFSCKNKEQIKLKKKQFKRFVFSFFVELFLDWIIFTDISSKKQGPKISLCECQSFKNFQMKKEGRRFKKKIYMPQEIYKSVAEIFSN